MPFFPYSVPGIRIAGIAAAVPAESVPLSSCADRFEKDYIEKFSATSAIRQIRCTAPGQTASDLCFAAAENLLNTYQIGRSEIGLLVFATHSPDYRCPATACVLQDRLALSSACGAFDLGLGCSAYPYALLSAGSLLTMSGARYALVLAGDTLTKVTGKRDRSTVMLFGDAGSCTLLEKAEGCTIRGLLKSDGSGYRDIIIPAGEMRNPSPPCRDEETADGCTRSLYDLTMNGMNVFSFSIGPVPKAVKEFYAATGTGAADYDLFAFHQSNKQIIEKIAGKIGAPAEKIPLCLEEYGNTSSASIPLALSSALGGNHSDKPLNTLFCGYGVGLSIGIAAAPIRPGEILPPVETDAAFPAGVINSLADLEED